MGAPDKAKDQTTSERSQVPTTLVHVTDRMDGTARVRLDLIVPWCEVARLLQAIPIPDGLEQVRRPDLS